MFFNNVRVCLIAYLTEKDLKFPHLKQTHYYLRQDISPSGSLGHAMY